MDLPYTVMKTEKELTEKTPLKGKEFEDEVEEQLQEIINPYGDTLTDVRVRRGISGKTGDYTIHLREDQESTIVVEAKNSDSYSVTKTEEEIEEAIQNRKAHFGIFVFSSKDQVPKKLRPIKISRNYIITSIEDNCLYFSYRVARMFVECQRSKSEDVIPISKIQDEITNLLEKNGSIEDVIKKARNICDAGEDIESILKVLRDDIADSLSKIQRHLNP